MKNLFVSIGTGPGIGMETALRFAREGFQPVLAARNMEKLESLARGIRSGMGIDAETSVLDAVDNSQIASLVERFGKDICVLHYNAAVLRPQFLEESTAETLAADMQVNLTGALVAVKTVLPYMRERGEGTILLTGGGFALSPSSEFLTLSLGKAGIRCLSQALFPDLSRCNVHIASVTVKKAVQASEGDPEKIAELFWKIHQQPRDAWTWEECYG